MTRRAGPVADLGIGTGRFDSTTESRNGYADERT